MTIAELKRVSNWLFIALALVTLLILVKGGEPD